MIEGVHFSTGFAMPNIENKLKNSTGCAHSFSYLPRSINKENKNYKNSFDFEILPNPATLSTRLDLEEVHGQNIKIDIFNSIGGFVKTISVDRVSERFLYLDLEDFSSGVYLVRMQVDNDHFIINKLPVGK